MKTGLAISPDLTLPTDAITQTFSILAMRRMGKTYTASVMAEEFVKAGLPFAVLDPTGAWWGLRSSFDGKSEGLPVVIIGGEHGDVPLTPGSGGVVAELVVDHPGFYVIDLSNTESNAEQDRFATDFAERLYRYKNKVRNPLHLFVDEADAFAPQKPMPGQQRMLGAFEALVRRGGIRGIGTTMITQRPAVLNKNVLTQTDSLFVLQMNSSQDQDAIDDWVKRNGTKDQRDVMMDSLASLPKGTAWFWSPGWLQEFKRVRIRQRHTFNSSMTPVPGETRSSVGLRLAPVDLDKLKEKISATVERAKENDPATLKQTIAELRQKVHRLESLEQLPSPKPEVRNVPVLTEIQEDRLLTMSKQIAELDKKALELVSLTKDLEVIRASLKLDVANFVPKTSNYFVKPNMGSFTNEEASHILAYSRGVKSVTPVQEEALPGSKLSKCETAILRVLKCYFEAGRTPVQIAIISGYSSSSGGFNNALAHLRVQGLITRTLPIKITLEGSRLIGEVKPLPSGQQLVEYWLSKLSKCEAAILGALTQNGTYPAMTADEIASNTGYQRTSGGFNNALSRLRTLELITRGNPINASPCFLS